ncbi:hypothetical protein JTE90_000880 [Oedothorax gibbosus]|uniref:Uncharacterized protein n=1 Tax=Oedothorax gibbosus TaxID=931172 RepID=A0AAV6VVM2_9ARAC|nr:hypothetical protein JTE90_000880 [Oedothorax gibbosus]
MQALPPQRVAPQLLGATFLQPAVNGTKCRHFHLRGSRRSFWTQSFSTGRNGDKMQALPPQRVAPQLLGATLFQPAVWGQNAGTSTSESRAAAFSATLLQPAVMGTKCRHFHLRESRRSFWAEPFSNRP